MSKREVARAEWSLDTPVDPAFDFAQAKEGSTSIILSVVYRNPCLSNNVSSLSKTPAAPSAATRPPSITTTREHT